MSAVAFRNVGKICIFITGVNGKSVNLHTLQESVVVIKESVRLTPDIIIISAVSEFKSIRSLSPLRSHPGEPGRLRLSWTPIVAGGD